MLREFRDFSLDFLETQYNALYHIVHDKKQLSSYWRVDNIKLWLDKNNTDYLSQGLKTKKDLLKLCEENKKLILYSLDKWVAENTPHRSLRTPPYTPEFDAIEKIWGIVKPHFDKSVGPSYDFSVATIKKSWDDALKTATPVVWNNTVEHVDKKNLEAYNREVVECYEKNR